MSERQPKQVRYSKAKAQLELDYDSGETHCLSAEFLRVMSPSAEVQGHGQPVLQVEKKDVRIWKIEPVGRYALKLYFDDGHDSGLFTWAYLDHLGCHQAQLWQDYLDRLAAAGERREPRFIPLAVDATRASE